ncbi:MAG TPA: hypothetical protein VJ654_00980 [Noviherbaspirillum sp.]|nr:hypothetical protein [Noviherbaspirillum sp.]
MSILDDHQVPPEPAPGDDPIPEKNPSPDEEPIPDHNPVKQKGAQKTQKLH